MTETVTGYEGTLNIRSSTPSTTYGADIAKLSLKVVFESESTVRVKITDASKSRWEIPETLLSRTHASVKIPTSQLNFRVEYTETPFSFQVIRNADNLALFSLDSASFVFTNQYIQVKTSIDKSAKTYGLGESTRLTQALSVGTTVTLWAADMASLVMNTNLYGSFPYYVQLVNGLAHGVMMLNSNGMDVSVGAADITFAMIGGVVDLYVFAGSSPSEVVQQYTEVVGRPAMMPYWSLGFHNCKYGYTSIYQVEAVVANYSAANIPLDTQWVDIDYMQAYRDFTFDSVNFPLNEVVSFVEGLHKNGQHFVPIIDPGIMVYAGYDAYEKGLQQDVFVKDVSGGNYLGQVWPGPTHFPDFFHPKAQAYWTEQIQGFHDMVSFDGIWIDMNEIANFCNTDGTGQVCANTASSGCPAAGASQTECCLSCKTVDGSNSLDFPPYAIKNVYNKLSTKTMAMSGSHYGDIKVYDAHNLYGLSEQKATNKALVDTIGKRPFILSRSSFISTGVHSAKWTGDNGATWNDLKSSIISVVDFNMFGVPMIGADICGFIFDTTEELCSRWIEVGAFYPFVRNHNTLGAAPQELYLWDSVAEASRNALNMRYTLLPYLYTLFYNANTAGDMVARALWMNFPEDASTVGIDSQFMWGNALLFSPVVTQGATSVNAYFPAGQRWYSLQLNSSAVAGVTVAPAVDTTSKGVFKNLYTPLTATNIHLRGGSVVPLQQAAMTTTLARKTPFSLLAALCPYGKAFGSLFLDDGEQVELSSFLSVSYLVQADSSSGSFTATVNKNTYSTSASLSNIIIAGIENAPSSASVNGRALSSSQILFDAAASAVTFAELGLTVSDTIVLTWK